MEPHHNSHFSSFHSAQLAQDDCCAEMFRGNGNSNVSRTDGRTNLRTNGLTWVGATDTCVSKKGPQTFSFDHNYHHREVDYQIRTTVRCHHHDDYKYHPHHREVDYQTTETDWGLLSDSRFSASPICHCHSTTGRPALHTSQTRHNRCHHCRHHFHHRPASISHK